MECFESIPRFVSTPMSQTAPKRRPLGLVALAFILGGLQLLILGFWAGKRDERPSAVRDEPAPTIVLITPTDGAAFRGSVPLAFETLPALRPARDGWGISRWQLRAEVDGELLVAARDVVEVFGNGRYRWPLHDLPPGRHRVRLLLTDARTGSIDAATPWVEFLVE